MADVPIRTGTLPRVVYPHAFDGWLNMTLQTYPSLIGECFTTLKSTQSIEQDTVIRTGGLPQVTAEGEAVKFDSVSQGATKYYTHAGHQQAYAITFDAIEDGKAFSIVEMIARSMGEGHIQGQNIYAYDVLNNAYGTEKSADGATLISASHPSSVGNLSNKLSTNAAFSEASLEQMSLEVSACKKDNGFQVPTWITKVILPRQLQFSAVRILDNPNRPGTTDRDINATYVSGTVPDAAIIDYLDSATAWYVLTNHNNKSGLKFYNRHELMRREDKDFATMNLLIASYSKYSAGCSEYRAIYGSEGTG